jgi:hypothetical protein
VLTIIVGGSPSVVGAVPIIDGSELGVFVALPAGVFIIEIRVSPSPHARVINGTAKHETTTERLPNIAIQLLSSPAPTVRTGSAACRSTLPSGVRLVL